MYCCSACLKLTPIDSAIAKQLVDKMYEKRKAAALDLEKCIIYNDSRLLAHCLIDSSAIVTK